MNQKSNFVHLDLLQRYATGWLHNVPFPHYVIDGFFHDAIAQQLESEFPDFASDVWHTYGNAIEVKKTCNNWNVFPEMTYQVLQYLNAPEFVDYLAKVLFDKTPLYPDIGLNGGGWHIHAKGGKLNTHLDYSIHPKMGKQRKINIIVYLNSSWDPSWGGSLGLWGNESNTQPGPLKKQIAPKFNRAVIFDTTCNSWHGLPDPLMCPTGQYRKSLAIYYLTDPQESTEKRGKALFAPTEAQQNDQDVITLIKKRSQVATSSSVYQTDK